jgi:ribosomal protein L34E
LIEIDSNKIDSNFREEKRAFNEEWENKYMVLQKPDSSEQVAVCAICGKEINQIKSYAMQRHYTTHEQEVQTIYGNPVTRKTRLDKVKNELIQQQKKMKIFLSRNELRLANSESMFRYWQASQAIFGWKVHKITSVSS